MVETVICRVEDGPSGRALEARAELVGEDLVIVIGGGEQPHVGCAVLARPVRRRSGGGWSPSTSVLTIPPHKEEAIARPIAEELVSKLGRVVVATAGVHDDCLDHEGIECYLRLAGELAARLAAVLRDEVGVSDSPHSNG